MRTKYRNDSAPLQTICKLFLSSKTKIAVSNKCSREAGFSRDRGQPETQKFFSGVARQCHSQIRA